MKNGYWQERIEAQLKYLDGIEEVSKDLILKAREVLDSKSKEEGAITKSTVCEVEAMLKDAYQAAKKYRILCVSHAHIDMNWMWGYAETVAITLETFRTMLNLMNEYPGFTFSQSQASVYRIVEEHDPQMLEEIKKRVKENRFEVTASTWVETDKNMPSGESLARHILYTKRYLSDLLDICSKSLVIDFEPDTFGHSRNVPEILNNADVKYYYHCRGYDGHIAYRWKAPSGSSVLVYREPFWYNAAIEPSMAYNTPEVCKASKINTMLKVYGVGDHGGGPTRKDIESIIDMGTWPAFPRIEFGTFREFFDELDKVKDDLPIVDQELNFIFTGCYTSQSRIKMANRIGEAKLYDSEILSALSRVFASGTEKTISSKKAWEKVLFNHFHDIIPGSGVIETREYALAKFQEVLASANTNISSAIRCFTDEIDTNGYFKGEEDYSYTVSEGAGVGHGIKDFVVPRAERGKGRGRVLHFFNPGAYDRFEVVETVIWDWPGDIDKLKVTGENKEELEFQVIPNENSEHFGKNYWGHSYMRVLVKVYVPAFGYSTCFLNEDEGISRSLLNTRDPRVNRAVEYILENDDIKVIFNDTTMEIESFVDKRTKNELITGSSGIFRLIEEDDSRKMTSWIVGRYMKIHELNKTENVKITGCNINKNALRQWIEYEIVFNDSKLKANISLDKNAERIDFKINCDWQEKPVRNKFVPQLNFYVPLNYGCREYKYDVPFGVVSRPQIDDDVPANSFMSGIPEKKQSHLMLVSDTKYGFRGNKDSMSLDLLRSSYDPDPYPEIGMHDFGFSVMLCEAGSLNSEMVRKSLIYNHPLIYMPGKANEGTRPLSASFAEISGGHVILSAVKNPEDGNEREFVLRFYETDGLELPASVRFSEQIKSACLCDINENYIKDLRFDKDTVSFIPGKNKVCTIKVGF